MDKERSGEGMKLGAFFHPTGNHVAGWLDPDAQIDAGTNFRHYAEITRTAEAHEFDDILGKLVSVTAQVSADGPGGSDMEGSISGNRPIAKGDASQVRSGLCAGGRWIRTCGSWFARPSNCDRRRDWLS